jgi:hypothetical protein
VLTLLVWTRTYPTYARMCCRMLTYAEGAGADAIGLDAHIYYAQKTGGEPRKGGGRGKRRVVGGGGWCKAARLGGGLRQGCTRNGHRSIRSRFDVCRHRSGALYVSPYYSICGVMLLLYVCPAVCVS